MLDIASNRIKKIENISHLTELQEFWVSLTRCDWRCSSARPAGVVWCEWTWELQPRDPRREWAWGGAAMGVWYWLCPWPYAASITGELVKNAGSPAPWPPRMQTKSRWVF